MTHDVVCGVCSRPVADMATICVTDAMRLDEAIGSVCGWHGLAWALDTAIAKQVRIGDRNGSRSAETGLPWNDKASRASQRLTAALSVWANRIAQETGDRPPPSLLAPCAAWLRPRVGWLRHHERGPEAFAAILDAIGEARRSVDRPPDRVYAGPCGATTRDDGGQPVECVEDLYAFPDAAFVSCRGCGAAWDVQERRRWLLAAIEDTLASATEISRAVTRYARPVTPSAIRNYASCGLLAAKGARRDGGRPVPLYRIGDVLDVLARMAEKAKAS